MPKWPLWSWFLAAAIFVAGANVAFGLPRYTTTSSDYCLSCHSTGETLDAARASFVHPSYDRVGCTDCHSRPGEVVAEGYRNGYSADPERVSANCTKCHQGVAGTDEQRGFKYNRLEITIPHRFHVETVKAQCTDCHRNVAHDFREDPTNRPRMDYCFSCHQSPESRTCNKCHQAQIPQGAAQVQTPRQPAGDTSDSGADLYAANCASCHGKDGMLLPSANLGDRERISRLGKTGVAEIISAGSAGMPAYASEEGGTLSQGQVQAITDYVLSLPGDTPRDSGARASATTTPDSSASGTGAGSTGTQSAEELYSAYCQSCHGNNGSNLAMADLGSKEFLSSRTDQELFTGISLGRGAMPAYGTAKGGPLEDDQILSLIELFRTWAGL